MSPRRMQKSFCEPDGLIDVALRNKGEAFQPQSFLVSRPFDSIDKLLMLMVINELNQFLLGV